MIYRHFGKRALDFSLGLFALCVFAIPVLTAIVAIKINSPGPAFFSQTRVGRDGQLFRIYKLRTMVLDPDREETIQVGSIDPSVFIVGRFLRRFKIDEMPQILNVILGDMSFVGPRPCLKKTYDTMPKLARRRFEERPGITGLAQTCGNIALSWEKRWEQDIQYVDQLSFSLDIRIMIKTVIVVILGEEKFEKYS